MDPDWGHAGLYFDGKLVYDFYDKDPFRSSLDFSNGWEWALENLAEAADWDFEIISRRPVLIEIKRFGGFSEYDSRWPQLLSDTIEVEEVIYDEDSSLSR